MNRIGVVSVICVLMKELVGSEDVGFRSRSTQPTELTILIRERTYDASISYIR